MRSCGYILIAALALLPVGCGASRHPAAASRLHRDPHYISLEEIRNSGEATAYDVVETLRPLWFHKRGPESFLFDSDILVYDGDAKLGDRYALREIAASSIASLRFLDAKAATYRYGASHPHGVIVVSTVFPVGQ